MVKTMTTNQPEPVHTAEPATLKILETKYLDCIHCGLCLSACPTFTELGIEMDSPRGRIYMMRAHAEEKLEITDNYINHIDLCLGCRACETACPSSVHFGHMLEDARDEIRVEKRNSLIERSIFNIVFSQLIPKHHILTALFTFLAFYQKSGIEKFIKASGLLRILPEKFRKMITLLPELPDQNIRKTLPEVNIPEGESKCTVGLLRGCIADFMFCDVNAATVRVLNKNHCTVLIPSDQVCCGALHAHSGYKDQARDLARKNIDVFEKSGIEYLIVNSAGCGAALKEYDVWLADDPAYAERAKDFVKKVKDITEFLLEIEPVPAKKPLKKKVVYHDACHLAHAQGIRKQPRDMLTELAGVEVLSIEEADICCGSAGIYNIIQPDMSSRLLKRKVKNILAADGEVVATGNPGCLIQIRTGIQEKRNDLPVVHTIELLDMAYRNENNTEE